MTTLENIAFFVLIFSTVACYSLAIESAIKFLKS